MGFLNLIKKKLFLYVAFSIIITFILYHFLKGQLIDEQLLRTLPESDIKAEAKGVAVSLYDREFKINYIIKSTHTIYKEQKDFFKKPQLKILDKQKNIVWQIYSDNAYLFKNKTINFNKNIMILSGDKKEKIQTEKLWLDIEKKTIYSDEKVTYYNSFLTIKSKGIKGSISQGRLFLNKVTSFYEK